MAIQEEVAPLHLKLDEQKNKLMPFQKEIDSAQGELDLANNEKNIFLSKSEAAEAKLRAATSDIESLKETIAGRGKRGKQIEKEIAQCKFDLQQKEEELEVPTSTVGMAAYCW
jgi:chromosome segregation ATPase